MTQIDATKLVNPAAELFKWGPMPVRYHYQGEFNRILSLEKYKKLYDKYRWPVSVALYKNGNILWVNEIVPLAESANNIFTDILQNPKKFREIMKRWKECVHNLQEESAKVLAISLSALSQKEFLDVFNSFNECVVDAFMIGLLPETVTCGLEISLAKDLATYITNETERMHAMQVLTAPTRASYLQTEECELAATKSEVNLIAHQKKYFWINNSFSFVKEEPYSYFAERKQKLNSNISKNVATLFAAKIYEKKELVKKYKLPRIIAQLGDAIADCAMWQDDRKVEILKILHVKSKLCIEASARLGISFDDLLDYDTLEISNMFVQKPTKKQLSQRKLGFGQIASEQFIKLNYIEANNYWNTYTHVKVESGTNSVKGKLASKGSNSIVQGTARIILDVNNVKAVASFNDADILIAPFTEPEYISLMKKAGAIITDEGSLTSHAAITSRELGKLCIVGTKMATKVFKDGDLIEVDANNGVVRKI